MRRVHREVGRGGRRAVCGRVRHVPAAAAVALGLLLVLPAAPPWTPSGPVLADRAEPQGPLLPTARDGTSAVWDGQFAYIFGGSDGAYLDQILRFDPRAGTVDVLPSRLPTPRYAAAAVWDGQHAYLFGGWGATGGIGEVVRFTPADGSVRVMQGKVSPFHSSAAAWDGRYAYIIGGVGSGYYSPSILRYDPVADTVTHVLNMASGRGLAPGVWDPRDRPGEGCPGGCAYVFPGNTFDGDAWDVLRFNPATGSVARAGLLAVPRYQAAAVWHGDYAYVFGGTNSNLIQRWDPRTPGVFGLVMPATLPAFTVAPSAVTDGTAMYVFGGQGSRGILLYLDRAPVAVVGAPAAAECIGGRGDVSLDGSGSYDPDGDVLTFQWSAPGAVFANAAAARTPGSFPLGDTVATLAVSDGPNTVTAQVLVRVVDTVPPAVQVTRPREGTVYVLDEVKLPHGKFHDKDLPALAVGPLTVMAQASDRCGLVHVSFLASDGEQAVVPAPRANYTFLLQPPAGHAGALAVEAAALDLGGHQATDSITYLHVGTNPMPPAMAACTFLFRASECTGLRSFAEQLLDGARPPQDLEDVCRLLLGGTACDEFTGP